MLFRSLVIGQCSCILIGQYLIGLLVLPTKHVLHGSADDAVAPGWGVGPRHYFVILHGILVGLRFVDKVTFDSMF